MMATEDPETLTRRLMSLGNQLIMLAGELATYEQEYPDPGHDNSGGLDSNRQDWLPLAQVMYRERLRRSDFVPAHFLGEPGWDILLDLYIAEEINRRVSITSACIASNVPPTTALRWVAQLELEGMIERRDDRMDGRRSFVRLTKKAYLMMASYFAAAGAIRLRGDIRARHWRMTLSDKDDARSPFMLKE